MKDEVFADYAPYLQSNIWPSVEQGFTGEKHTLVTREVMAPQYAASALAKLVRWARIAPSGDIAYYGDEDSRENAVRETPLGTALAARACNLEIETFHALYGDYAAGAVVDPHELLAELAISLGDHGLADWSLRDRLVLSGRVLDELLAKFVVTSRTTF